MAIQIPRSGLPDAQQGIVQAPRVRPSMDAPNFGGGQAAANAFGQARGLAGDASEGIYREEMRAQEAQYNKLSALIEREEFNQRSSLGKVQGEAALKASMDSLSNFDKGVGDIIGKEATSEAVRERLKLHAERNRMALQRFSESHATREKEAFELQALSSNLDNIENSAIQGFTDPLHIALKLDEQQQALKRHAALTGKPKEWLEAESARRESRVHQGVINQLLAAGKDIDAKDYFAANKDGISGKDQPVIKARIQDGVDRGSAYAAVDDAMLKATSRKQLMEMVRSLPDEVREKAEPYAWTRWSQREQEQRELSNATFNAAGKAIEKDDGKAKDLMELVVWNMGHDAWDSMGSDDKKELEKQFRIRRGYEAATTDNEAYYALRSMGANEDTRQDFLKLDLSRYRSRLTPQDFQELATFQTGLIKNESRALAEAEGYRTTDQIVTGAANAIKNKEDREQFRRAVDAQIRARKRDPKSGGIVSTEEVEKVVDGMLRDITTDPWRWYRPWDKTESAYKVTNKVAAAQREFVETNIKPDEVLKIKDALKRSGRPATDEAILELYEKKLKLGATSGR